jgi:hypothetical protein
MKMGFVGLESSGKSLSLALKALQLLKRNKKWRDKHGFTRKVYSNLKFSKEIEKEYKDFIAYWSDPKEVVYLIGVDIIWDEISAHFSALKQSPLPISINVWLRQGAKQGTDIYFTAQEFHDVHNDFRRRCQIIYEMRKIIGSDRGGKNLPPVKFIWGLCSIRLLIINPYNELNKQYLGLWFFIFPAFLLIRKKYCQIFDTHQIIKRGEEQPLEHTERICPDCGYVEVYHSGRKTKSYYLKDDEKNKKLSHKTKKQLS